MKCSAQPVFLAHKPDKIREIFEIRLPKEIWLRLRDAATRKRKTLSTITRYCTFMLAERSSLRRTRGIEKLIHKDKQDYRRSELLHRHMLCLYGDDAQFLRLTAMKLQVSVSCLVRIALLIFLRQFDMESHSHRSPSEPELFWRGIKRFVKLLYDPTNYGSLPCARAFLLLSFPPEMRWNWP